MDRERTVNRVGWVNQFKSTPPLTREYIERQYRFFEIQVRYLQENGFTTRTLLKEHEQAVIAHKLRVATSPRLQ
jgi:hypothetical protein